MIGGLIDRTVIKNASLSRAAEYQIKTKKLPIDEYCQEYLVLKKALSINQVVELLLVYKDTKDWKKAFD